MGIRNGLPEPSRHSRHISKKASGTFSKDEGGERQAPCSPGTGRPPGLGTLGRNTEQAQAWLKWLEISSFDERQTKVLGAGGAV